jgi:hypothetical protein
MFKIILIVYFITLGNVLCQEPGIDKPEWDSDSTIIFKSPRPILDPDKAIDALTKAFGAEVGFSPHGTSFGLFFTKKIGDQTHFLVNMVMSSAKRETELEQFDWNTGRFIVPGKINRILMVPISFGLKSYVFQDAFEGNLKPYVSAGGSVNYIMTAPYTENREFMGEFIPFFRSLNQLENYIRFGGFVDIGFDFSPMPKQNTSINVRYYYIPFGGDGLESVYMLPIQNFGGLFISLAIGVRF